MAVPSLPAKGSGKPGMLQPGAYRETRYARPTPVAIITMRRARPKVSCFFPLLALRRRMEGLSRAYESGAIYQFMTHDYDRLDSEVMDSMGTLVGVTQFESVDEGI